MMPPGGRFRISSLFAVFLLGAGILVPLLGGNVLPSDAAPGAGTGAADLETARFVPTPDATAGGADDGAADAVLQTYGSHQYWTQSVGHPAESALISHMDGTVWVADTSRLKKTTNGGQTWQQIAAFLPPNLGILVVPEGDIAVAPNGDIVTAWLTPNQPQGSGIWVSKNGGSSFLPAAVGLAPVPDRPWISTSANAPAGCIPGGLSPYSSFQESGVGIKPVYVSLDRGTTYELVETNPIPALTTLSAFPALAPNPYLNFVKPFAQGWPTKYITLPDGQVVDVGAKQFTCNFLQWKTIQNGGLFFPPGYPYLDVSSQGILYAVKIAAQAGQWKVFYKWYDGVWHDGAVQPLLAAQPDFPNGLDLNGGAAAHDVMAAVKSHDGLLGIATREGLRDVLIRINGAATATPTWTKEVIGPGGGPDERFDFPNLVFDTQGRAVLAFDSSWVAYATTP